MELTAIYSSPRIQQLISDNMSQVIQDSLNISVTSSEVKIIQKINEFEIRSLGLLRYFTNKKSHFTILGTSDLNTYNYLHTIENKKLLDFETQILKVLNDSIAEEVKAHQQNNEIKSMMIGAEDQLAFFKKIESKHVLQINFTITDFNLIFDLPISSPSYLPATFFENTGFIDQVKILIVDDSKLNRLILKNYLLTVGFINIEEAYDGQDALFKILHSVNGFGLIIADWHMPEVSGLELLKKVRTNADTKNTPFILATSEQKKEEVLEALKLKVSGYIVKPYSAEMLIKSIKAASKK